ncbi:MULTISPECIES: phage tail protein [Pandoraea]|uniref:phage tail protein n=1 Tax=Pandoraea TaxID=93217 RepID=UPI001F5E1E85|nr:MULTISPECIES: phage tail protein [Pandoraea]MCI3205834.1 hypothetical protein [Pandoraea sp. LA3]MDN4583862.1 hypothetical protein [Pandoraea capi]
MTATYFTIATDIGNAKEANAIALGLRRKFVALAVGDGGGDNAPVPTPKPNQKALLGEWRRAPLNSLEPDPKNPAQLIAEQIIPENEGGKWIREMALIDEDGDICYVSNAPPTYKPLLPEGSEKTQGVRMVIIVSNVASVELKVDPSVVLATREYADKAADKAAAGAAKAITVAMSDHLKDEDPHSQYAKKTAVLEAISGAVSEHIDDEDPHKQYAKKSFTPLVYSITDLPKKNVGPITVAECGEIWIWSQSGFFTGYRSPLCGRPVDGHTLIPLPSEIDAVGGTLSKSAYASLWAYAQENALVVPSASWAAGTHRFVDLGGDNFRAPDLRNQFRRYTGTDADTANARTLGSGQVDQLRSHRHATLGTPPGSISQSGSRAYLPATGSSGVGPFSGGDTTESGGTETRPINTAYAPRIHI